jgi:hypothetical protein
MPFPQLIINSARTQADNLLLVGRVNLKDARKLKIDPDLISRTENALGDIDDPTKAVQAKAILKELENALDQKQKAIDGGAESQRVLDRANLARLENGGKKPRSGGAPQLRHILTEPSVDSAVRTELSRTLTYRNADIRIRVSEGQAHTAHLGSHGGGKTIVYLETTPDSLETHLKTLIENQTTDGTGRWNGVTDIVIEQHTLPANIDLESLKSLRKSIGEYQRDFNKKHDAEINIRII